MKIQLTKKMTGTIAALALSVAVSFAGNSDTDTSKTGEYNGKCLEVTVKPTENDLDLNGVIIKVYLGNEAVSVINSDIIAMKKISLCRNKHYTIEISKKGYYSKLVSISTVLPKDIEFDDEFVYEYDLQLELVKQKKGADTYYMDFPAALISYDFASDKFDYSRKYTSEISNRISKELDVRIANNYKHKRK
jgi:hypothetical protein